MPDLPHRRVRPAAFSQLEMRLGLLGIAIVGQDLSGRKVCARQLPRVFGRLQESDRALDLAERGTWLALHQGKPGQRPVEANARVGIGRLLRFAERLPYDHTRALELTEVGEA